MAKNVLLTFPNISRHFVTVFDVFLPHSLACFLQLVTHSKGRDDAAITQASISLPHIIYSGWFFDSGGRTKQSIHARIEE